MYKKSFVIKQSKQGKRFFLFFEGVGSYATVYVNDKLIGSHNGGRTTFTLDVTDAIKTDGSQNNLVVKASHPSYIKDLPWVCGGCSDERGFSEGSQPLGIFRPVHLIVTNDVRVQPFGVHAWTGNKNGVIKLFINSTIKNYSGKKRKIEVIHQLVDAIGNHFIDISAKKELNGNETGDVSSMIRIDYYPYIKLWSPGNPYLYKIVTLIKENGIVLDETSIDYGFRTISWKNATNQFILNDQPVFLNGIGEYEHLLGQSHAFSKEQIVSRMKWVKAAGFNAFRDAHQPHNLLYGKLCDQMGILWWTQFSAHIWYDSPEFRNNFKQLLKEWVIERRNDPSVILWGLQNESKLPEDFAKECSELIRSLDPTSSSQRLITTCNGGSGTDWDVPQNWTGTYGGDPNTYASDLKKQVLIGEYGAWRTIDLHTEGGFNQNGVLSEDRMTQLMEQKIRLAESVKDSCAGQFFWLLTSHDNPGRVQGGEGLRELDRVGPVNYKGLLTPWEEPTDAFYMFRSNYAPKEKEPMVYIVSHTWPNRWMIPGIKNDITVYSNCDEVELFNDIDNLSLGKRKRGGIGKHFSWDSVLIRYNVLYAVGYVNGNPVARDTIVLNHLKQSPNFGKLYTGENDLVKPQSGYNYIYRYNCGGPAYTDQYSNYWLSDRAFSGLDSSRTPRSYSWANGFDDIRSFFASQRRTFSAIRGTNDWKLFQSFRYGKNELSFHFPVEDGEYAVELYFIEPWLGIGGGMDASGMRLFDVAINDSVVLDDLDIWKEAGTNTLLKKTVKVKVRGGRLDITFPESKAGQAIVSAIAVAGMDKVIIPHTGLGPIFESETKAWLDIGDRQYQNDTILFNSLPPNLYGASWISLSHRNDTRKKELFSPKPIHVFVAYLKGREKPEQLKEYENTNTEIITDENGGTYYTVYRKLFAASERVSVDIAPGYVVAMLPATNMQPAYDLKPVTSFRTNVAVISEGVQKEKFAERECAVIKSNAAVTIQWPVATGVADIYSVTLKYFSPHEKNIIGRLQLIGAGSTMMLEEPVSFTFTRPDKWNQFTINTGNMINAGNYIVRLIIENAEGLAISGIEIQ